MLFLKFHDTMLVQPKQQATGKVAKDIPPVGSLPAVELWQNIFENNTVEKHTSCNNT